jgi:hypothetical protein
LTCGRELGFLPDALAMVPLETQARDGFVTQHGTYRKCTNYVDQGVCNWMVPSASRSTFCQACELNHVIPNLSDPANRALWAEVENGKRRLIYGLNRLKLPLQSKQADPQGGLAFDIKSSAGSARVLTGHEDGLITLNLAEADSAEREKVRIAMKERYRTMLGHFRHEVGHYYWDKLVRDTPHLATFRELFGDETIDYATALKRHYATSPTPDYTDSFISAYAAAHPWEDFAETFAHFLHLEDTLETAHDFGVTSLASRISVINVDDFDLLMKEWTELTVALNALNRSMGFPDAYPFAISPRVKSKVAFVHMLVRRQASVNRNAA